MRLPYHFFIAYRYLKSRKRHKSVSFNTIISICGVTLGVMALTIVLSVMSGFHEDLKKKILGSNAHIIALSYDAKIPSYKQLTEKISNLPHVESASPFVLGQAMITHGKRAQGVFLRGIIPELEKNTTEINRHIKQGDFEAISQTERGLLIGKELANNLGVILNDEVNIIFPFDEIGPLGMIPKTRIFRILGIFEIGMYEYDSSLAITSVESAQSFFDLGDNISGIEIKIDDIYKADTIKEEIQKSLGFPYYTRDWMEMNKNLFSALKLEKFVMFIILTLIVLVAAFNIIGTLVMNVIEKEGEIAILKTMGATSKGIMSIFMLQGFFIGLIGTILGIAGGFVTCYLMDTYKLIKLPGDVYYLSHLPAQMNLIDFIVISVSAITISFLSTIYPSYQAAKLNPIEPLRFE